MVIYLIINLIYISLNSFYLTLMYLGGRAAILLRRRDTRAKPQTSELARRLN